MALLPKPARAGAAGVRVTVAFDRRGHVQGRQHRERDAMTTQQGESDTAQPEQKSITDRANLVARAEAAVALQPPRRQCAYLVCP
jgi:hypothetical protein